MESMHHRTFSSAVRQPTTQRVAVTTLGCKVNAFESELIAQRLQRRGWEVVDRRQMADLHIINTCTVTREADRQARQTIRRAIRQNPNALVVVTGCYAQMDAEACAQIPGVDLVLGNDRKLEVDQLLSDLQARRLPSVLVGDLDQHVSLPNELVAGYEGHTRAFIQVQQGCNQGCTFCIIHRARGPSRSLSPGLIARQVKRLVANGYREIVVCGVDLGAYGEDLSQVGFRLPDLLQEIVDVGGDFRVRLSSIDPAHLTDRLIDQLTHLPKLCPHLHLSLQSGNTLILKRMKRRYTQEWVYDRIGRLRRQIPNLVLSADVMVGFPTETDAQFRDTEHMVARLNIAFPHIFCFSERPGTPAARIPLHKQIPLSVRKQRATRLREVAGSLRRALLASRIGNRARVLVEGGGRPPPGYQRARSADYLSVLVPAGVECIGEWMDVVYDSTGGDALVARTIS